ncbi:MAG: D-alanyl-D-alanine endopeptidase (penicillin-binding protein 7) [Myxococcota bacterium]|jgi:D-alanyl-D-alanine endopeptidase (penicillin-binding protein 7)
MKLILRAALTALNGGLVAALITLWLPQSTASAHLASPAPPTAVERVWAPPAWHPGADELWVLEALDSPSVHVEGPKVRARAAIVADLDRGVVLWTKNADTLRTVASLTKMVSSLTLASHPHDLDEQVCITPDQWPARAGARSRFETGVCHAGWELIGAALVASDNRGAMALPTIAGVEYSAFVDDMHTVSRELRLDQPSWADPAGLDDANMASARDMLKAVVAVSAHPDLQVAATAREWWIQRRRGPQLLPTTNRLIDTWETLAAKTGYTDTARYTYATVVRTRSGRRLGVAVLGAPTNPSRFSDARTLIEWASKR